MADASSHPITRRLPARAASIPSSPDLRVTRRQPARESVCVCVCVCVLVCVRAAIVAIVRVCVSVCVCACVRAFVRSCVRSCVRACVRVMAAIGSASPAEREPVQTLEREKMCPPPPPPTSAAAALAAAAADSPGAYATGSGITVSSTLRAAGTSTARRDGSGAAAGAPEDDPGPRRFQLGGPQRADPVPRAPHDIDAKADGLAAQIAEVGPRVGDVVGAHGGGV